jgi:hypothetical protein
LQLLLPHASQQQAAVHQLTVLPVLLPALLLALLLLLLTQWVLMTAPAWGVPSGARSLPREQPAAAQYSEAH